MKETNPTRLITSPAAAIACMLSAFVLVAGCAPSEQPQQSTLVETADEYVGSEHCGRCHTDQFNTWQQSHHAQALQIASADTVLAEPSADHPQITLTQNGEQLLFAAADPVDPVGLSPIAYTFGLHPLQQYLVPGERGRYQALRWSWDSRASTPANKRWFQQYGQQTIAPDDVLHWQTVAQNWNTMCADCHSTGLAKNYSLANDAYNTTFAEISVGCEACHGPGSQHAENPSKALPASATLQLPDKQPDVCAQCHSRRSQLAEGFHGGKHLLDYYLPELLTEPAYHADGQIDDEVYVYGSFVSSKMYTMGVTCGDCHSPHSGELRFPDDATCTQCHSEAGNPRFASLTKASYADKQHHLHAPDSKAARCTTCHMPTKTYMGVDERHDHSFRVPALDLAGKHGVPDPCTQCHTNESVEWATSVLEKHFGRAPTSHFAHALVQTPQMPGGEAALAALAKDTQQSPISRASALNKLASGRMNISSQAVNSAVRDDDPLVRYGAQLAINRLSDRPAQLVGALRHGLSDELLSIRITAAQNALSLLDESQRQPLQPKLGVAVDEYISAQLYNAERPSAQVNLASIARSTGDLTSARQHLDLALTQQSSFIPALLNLVDLNRLESRESESYKLLVQATNIEPLQPDAASAFALWHARQNSYDETVHWLESAHLLAPERRDITYTFAVALNSTGNTMRALEILGPQLEQPQPDEQLLLLLATMARDAARLDLARDAVDRLVSLAPANAGYRQLSSQLSSGS